MINKVTLIGRLGINPEGRALDSGAFTCKFRLATDESYKKKGSDEWTNLTEWHNIIIWGANAERAEKNLKKGDLVYIEGKLSTSTWKDDTDRDCYKTEIKVSYYRFLANKKSNGNNEEAALAAENNSSNANVPDELPF